MSATEIFKALSDDTRLRLFRLLVVSGREHCCCELTDSVEEPQYNVSRHLKILRHAELVYERKEGRWVYFGACSAKDEFLKRIHESIKALVGPRFAVDLKNLDERLALRTDGKCCLGIQKTHLAGSGAAI